MRKIKSKQNKTAFLNTKSKEILKKNCSDQESY